MCATFTPASAVIPTEETYVILDKDGGVSDLSASVEDKGGDVEDVLNGPSAGVVAKLDSAEVATLAQDSSLVISKDAPVKALGTELYPPSWGLDRIDQAHLPLDSRFNYPSSMGAGVRIYIVDTGVTPMDEFGAGSSRLISGYSTVNDSNGTLDCNGHGTHVAGIAASATYGIAKLATVVPVRVLDCQGNGTTSSVIDGLNWIMNNNPSGPAVVNLSLSGDYNAALNSTIDTMASRGFVVTVAAGNDDKDACGYSPSSAAAALTVGATDQTDTRSSFSNWGNCLDIFAPGSSITSLYKAPGYTSIMSGTSMAAPHAAGVSALYLAENPGAGPAQVSAALLSAAHPGVINPGAGSPDKMLQIVTQTLPGTPGAPTASGIRTGSAMLSWSPGGGGAATSYTLQWRVAGGQWNQVQTSSPSYNLTGLAANTTYQAFVTANNSSGSSNPTSTSTFTTSPMPSSPLNLRQTSASASSIELGWDIPSVAANVIDGYALEYSADGSSWTAGPSPLTTVASLTSLSQGSYQVRVAAVTDGKKGPWAYLSAATGLVPDKINTLTYSNPSFTSVTLAWTSGYSLSPVSSYELETVNGSAMRTFTAARSPYLISGLTPGGVYQIRVRALNSYGPGAWSDAVTVALPSVPGAPQSLNAQAASSSSVNLTWAPPANGSEYVTGYQAYVSQGSSWTLACSTQAWGRSCSVGGLSADTRYYFKVNALYSDGVTLDSGYASASTLSNLSPTQKYVVSVYGKLFHRWPDPSGLQTWTGALINGAPRRSVADSITSSPEYRSRLIINSYSTYLNRGPDPVGLNSWLSEMNKGMTIQQMEGGFVASDEFYLKSGGTDSGWVNKLYESVLDRNPSPAEVNFWVAQAQKSSRYQVAMGFLLSNEHLSSVINGQYEDLLGRGLDPAGQAFWVKSIQSGVRVEVVIGGIIASEEYWSKNS